MYCPATSYNNESLRLAERRRPFKVTGFHHLIAKKEENIMQFEKLVEGGFNRIFLVTSSMRGSFQPVARIPYLSTQPQSLKVASEAATMDFLHGHSLPIPRIYWYSADSENPVGTPYMLMAVAQGLNLSEVWSDISDEQRMKFAIKQGKLEMQIYGIDLPSFGSIYHERDVERMETIPILGTNGEFYMGPDTTFALWFN
ncbi:kinase-like protein [Penicillium lividum]|nr:kinase-like protein [Penicillium lividum]